MGELQDDMPIRQLRSLQLVICAPDDAIWQALLSACENNRVVEVASLLQKPLDPNWREADTYLSPIHHAAKQGHLEVVRILLEAGADQNAATANGITALMFAARQGHLEVVRLLLETGADKNAAMAHGRTALMLAAKEGHLDVVRTLLKAGADMNAATADGRTASMLAAADGHLEVTN